VHPVEELECPAEALGICLPVSLGGEEWFLPVVTFQALLPVALVAAFLGEDQCPLVAVDFPVVGREEFPVAVSEVYPVAEVFPAGAFPVGALPVEVVEFPVRLPVPACPVGAFPAVASPVVASPVAVAFPAVVVSPAVELGDCPAVEFPAVVREGEAWC
jgi:hypothetical protein